LLFSLNGLRCFPCDCHCLWTSFGAFLVTAIVSERPLLLSLQTFLWHESIPLARPLFLALDILRLGSGPLICTILEVSEPIGNYPFVLSHYSLCCYWWSSIVAALGLVLAISFIHRRTIAGEILLFLYNISLNIGYIAWVCSILGVCIYWIQILVFVNSLKTCWLLILLLV